MGDEGLRPVPDNQDFIETIQGLAPGQRLFSRYVLVRVIGRGGMGLVWLAHDETLGEEIALKFLPETVRVDGTALEELKRETRRSRKLAHPNIVKVYDFVSDANAATISMEFIDGATLSAMRAKQPDLCFQVSEIEPWVKQMLNALSYAHEGAKVVHRDLKPANIMVDKHGQVKVTDFGIASSINENVTRVTMARGTSGTVCYMSPQQAMGEAPCPRDDIYALGATLFELLTSKPPFFRGDILSQVWETVPPTMAARRAELEIGGEEIPEAWEQTLAACLAKNPEERPQSMAEVAFLLGLRAPVAVTRTTTATVPRVVAAAPLPAPEPQSFVVKEAKSMMTAAIIVGIILAVFAAIVVGYHFLVPAKKADVVATDETTATPATQLASTTTAPRAGNFPKAGRPWTNSLGMKFVPAGTDGVLFNVWDVRVQDFRAYVQATGAQPIHGIIVYKEGNLESDPNTSWENPGFEQGPTEPVIGVSWDDAKGFCQWLTAKERTAGTLGANQAYRLPTDAEWSKAAGEGKYPWGNEWPPPKGSGNYGDESFVSLLPGNLTPPFPGNDGYPHTSPVGSFKANAYGLYDMGGNAWQWCEDWYQASMNSAEILNAVPNLRNDGGGRAYRVYRGASWVDNNPVMLLSSCRSSNLGSVNAAIGFRVVIVCGPGTDTATQTTLPGPDSAVDTTPEPAVVAGDSPEIAAIRAKAVAGDAKAANYFADQYISGAYGLPKDPVQNFKWRLKSAEGGYDRAQDAVGQDYLMGTGVAKDPGQALAWWQKSANQENVDAENRLGRFYAGEWGAQPDLNKSRYWFQKAAEHPVETDPYLNEPRVQAQVQLGVIYEYGTGVPQDYSQALSWFQKAANDPGVAGGGGKMAVGNMYLNGIGVTKDYAQALSWFQKSADQGNLDGEEALGEMYLNGTGVEKDYGKAMAFFQKVGDNAVALNNLGVMYENGWGVPKDMAKAVELYKKAAAGNLDLAKAALQRLADGGTAGQAPAAADVAAAAQTKAPTPNADVAAALQTKPSTPDAAPAADAGAAGTGSSHMDDLRTRATVGDVKAAIELAANYGQGTGVPKDTTEQFKWLLKAAEGGDAQSQGTVGYLYTRGIGVTQDYAKAFGWLQKSAAQGDADAEHNLADAYMKGQGVTQDASKALAWSRKAADNGNSGDQTFMGQAYEYGDGGLVVQDYSQALAWYQKAANNGDGDGQVCIGHMYLDGVGVAKDYSQALIWFQKAADQGNPNGECDLGEMYMNGWGVVSDYSKALSLFQKCGDLNAEAPYNLGVMYENGWGVAKDRGKALDFYRKSAAGNLDQAKAALTRLGAKAGAATTADATAPSDDVPTLTTKATAGDAVAARTLGLAYLHGDGVAKDEAQGRKWLEQAAEKDDSIAEDAVANLWQNGIGGKKDAVTAFNWFKKAADQGIANSEFNLAQDFYNGTGVEKDFGQALDWFQKAATANNREAQFNLGVMYEDGDGVIRNSDKAAEWYKKSAANGYRPAQDAVTRLGQ